MKYIIIALILQFFSLHSIAASNFNCIVKGVSSINKNGDLEKKYEEPYVNNIFKVARESGIMNGILQNNMGGKPRIIEKGSKDWSFKVITESHTDHSDIYYLTIQEYVQNKEKPFMFIQSGYIFHGICSK